MFRGIATYMRRHHLGLLALFVALGGTSIAASNALLPRNSVGSAQVVNGSLQKTDLSPKAVRALKGNRGARGPQGLTGSQGPKGDQGLPGASATKLWASVAGDGTLARGSGATGSTRTSLGLYTVTFNQDVSTCAWLASGTDHSNSVLPGADAVPWTGVGLALNQVKVATTYNEALTDLPFDIAVFC